MPILPASLLSGLVLFAVSIPGQPTQSVRTEHATAELIANVTSVSAGDSFWVALRLQPDADWYVYWSNPGDAGLPPSLEWQLPEGWSAGPVQFPIPTSLETPPFASFGYKGEVWYLVQIKSGGRSGAGPLASLRVKAEWLICREECVPQSADFEITVEISKTKEKIGTSKTKSIESRHEEWKNAFAKLPAPAPTWNWRASYEDSTVVIVWDTTVEGSALGKIGKLGQPVDAFFFPTDQGVITHAAPQAFVMDSTGARLTLIRDDALRAAPDTLRGVIVFGSGAYRRGYTLSIVTQQVQLSTTSQTDASRTVLILIALLTLAGIILLAVFKRPHLQRNQP